MQNSHCLDLFLKALYPLQKVCNIMFQKWGGSKAVLNFSKNSSDLVAGSFPYYLLYMASLRCIQKRILSITLSLYFSRFVPVIVYKPLKHWILLNIEKASPASKDGVKEGIACIHIRMVYYHHYSLFISIIIKEWSERKNSVFVLGWFIIAGKDTHQ